MGRYTAFKRTDEEREEVFKELHEKLEPERKRRPMGELMLRFVGRESSEAKNESGLGGSSAPQKPKRNVQVGELCPRKVGSESCWSTIADEKFESSLARHVDGLMNTHEHKLYQHGRRDLSIWYELFWLGQTPETARLVYIISCATKEDQTRVNGIIKKYSQLPDFDDIQLLTMIGSPKTRTSIPLMQYLSRSGSDPKKQSASRDPDGNPSNEADDLLTGTRVYATLAPDGSLTIPTTIWIGEVPQNQHRAVLGGLVSSEDGTRMGFTAAHFPSSSDGTEDSAPEEDSSRPGIGIISHVSSDFELALVKFDIGVRLRASIAPPTSIGENPRQAVAVTVLTPRESIRGSLSASLTHININGRQRSITTRSILTDQPLRAGDCGAWVVGPKGELYGHVAYGHPGEKVAYVIPASNAFDHFKETLEIKLSEISTGSQRKLAKEQNQAKTSTTNPLNVASRGTMDSQDLRYDSNTESTKVYRRRLPKKLQKLVRLRTSSRDWKDSLVFTGVYLTYLIILALLSLFYTPLAATALYTNSRGPVERHRALAISMLNIVDEMRAILCKEISKVDQRTLELPDRDKGSPKTNSDRQQGFGKTKGRVEKVQISSPAENPTCGQSSSFKRFWLKHMKKKAAPPTNPGEGNENQQPPSNQAMDAQPNEAAQPAKYSYSDDDSTSVSFSLNEATATRIIRNFVSSSVGQFLRKHGKSRNGNRGRGRSRSSSSSRSSSESRDSWRSTSRGSNRSRDSSPDVPPPPPPIIIQEASPTGVDHPPVRYRTVERSPTSKRNGREQDDEKDIDAVKRSLMPASDGPTVEVEDVKDE